jgi:hypothetical protein
MGRAVQPGIVVLVIVTVGLAVAACWWLWHHARRVRLYRALAEDRPRIVGQRASLVTAVPGVDGLADAFRRTYLVRHEEFLPEPVLRQLQEECLANAAHTERRSIPLHKKGATLSYEGLHRHAPACLSVFHSAALRRWVSDIVGAEVWPTADHDQSACSVLYYTEAGDHINWHYDHNFYKGRHFTVLLSLVNKAADGKLSSSRLQWKDPAGQVVPVDTAENTIVVFEGARVLHRVSPTDPGDVRVILSMTYCTDPRIGWFKETLRRFKDIAYIGVRALWD